MEIWWISSSEILFKNQFVICCYAHPCPLLITASSLRERSLITVKYLNKKMEFEWKVKCANKKKEMSWRCHEDGSKHKKFCEFEAMLWHTYINVLLTIGIIGIIWYYYLLLSKYEAIQKNWWKTNLAYPSKHKQMGIKWISNSITLSSSQRFIAAIKMFRMEIYGREYLLCWELEGLCRGNDGNLHNNLHHSQITACN